MPADWLPVAVAWLPVPAGWLPVTWVPEGLAATDAPRAAELLAEGVTVVTPLSPAPPETPDAAKGLEMAIDVASPVAPVLVAVAAEVEAPELPETAVGLTTTLVSPPPAPPDSDVATLGAPVAVWAPAGRTTTAKAIIVTASPATLLFTP